MGSEEEINYIDDLIKFGQVNKRKLSDFTNEKYVNSALKDQRKSREEYQVKMSISKIKLFTVKDIVLDAKPL